MSVTVEDAKDIWTGLHNQDFALCDGRLLTEMVVDKIRKSQYHKPFTQVEIPESVFDPRTYPASIAEAIEYYQEYETQGMDTLFLSALQTTKEVNKHLRDTRRWEWIGEITTIDTTDYVNTLFLMDAALHEVQQEKIKHKKRVVKEEKKKWFGIPYTHKEYAIQEERPDPIRVVTNPKEDGLVKLLEKNKERLKKRNRAVAIYNTGEKDNQEVQALVNDLPGSTYHNIPQQNDTPYDFMIATGTKTIVGIFRDRYNQSRPLFDRENLVHARYYMNPFQAAHEKFKVAAEYKKI